MLFRMSRTSIQMMVDENFRDYGYFKEKGWFEADYYHDISLGFIKKLAGRFFDFLGKQMVKHR